MPDIYGTAETIAKGIEAELTALNRWDVEPLPEEKYKDMGAFGVNTMRFEQWLQFILIPRVKRIVAQKGEFPVGSMLAAYALRVFDGDPVSNRLQQLLYDLDALINANSPVDEDEVREKPGPVRAFDDTTPAYASAPAASVSIGEETIPPVLRALAEVLPGFEGDDLESQLQTFDTFLLLLSPSARLAIIELLKGAASKAVNPSSKMRIEKAAVSITQGGRAADPYNHNDAMAKYREEQKKNFPGARDAEPETRNPEPGTPSPSLL